MHFQHVNVCRFPQNLKTVACLKLISDTNRDAYKRFKMSALAEASIFLAFKRIKGPLWCNVMQRKPAAT